MAWYVGKRERKKEIWLLCNLVPQTYDKGREREMKNMNEREIHVCIIFIYFFDEV